MREINTEITQYNLEEYADYEGGAFSAMDVAEDGYWVRFAEHYDIVDKLKSRITYLENVCDEQMRMLTGD